MITHLISTTEFVKLMTKDLTQQDWTGFCELPSNALSIIIDYANFISQKPELYMFVPCNELGEPYPDTAEEYWKDRKGNLAEEFKQAQSRVLFKGWKIDEDGVITTDNTPWFRVQGYDTLEDLIDDLSPYVQLKLTKTALKQIGLWAM